MMPIKTACPKEVLEAIYGPKSPTKAQDCVNAQERWWKTYSSRKMADSEEYTANAMVYDPNHMPHSPTAQTTPPAN